MAKLDLVTIPRAIYAVARVTPEGNAVLGTAFLVGKSRLATAAHLTGGDDRGLVILLNDYKSFGEYQETKERQIQYSAVRIHAIDTFRDICILAPEGDIEAHYKIGSTDLVVPGQTAVTFGFPHANTGRIVLTQQNVQVGAKVIIETGAISGKHLVLNTFAQPGQSGSPVFDLEIETVVAMILGAYAPAGGGGISLGGVNPAALNQTTHAVSAEYITKMIS